MVSDDCLESRMCRNAELRQRSRAEQIMPMSALRPHTWTVDEVERLAQQRAGVVPRYELVDGELLVTPAPDARHQRIVFHLGLALQEYLSRERVGELRLGPAEVRLSADTRFEPDLFVVAAIDGRFPAAGAEVSQPLLACEVLSPSSSRHDRITKRRAFQRYGIAEYWVIDGDAEAFEIWHPGEGRPALADARVVWKPIGAAHALEFDVRRFFARIADGAPLP
jgi:Uma2 family endonuclease